MKSIKRIIYLSSFSLMLIFTSCSEEWLEPEPQSFFAPENTFVDKEGFESLLLSSRKQLRHEYVGDNSSINTEIYLSDVAVTAGPEANKVHNLELQVLPTGAGNSRIMSGAYSYWSLGFNGIKYANIAISRVDDPNIEWETEEDRNEILAEGYFHRAYWYYRLVHQFGDVPLILDEVTEPRTDFNTYSRETILVQMMEDMEYAVQWLPESVLPGQINRAAGYHLLTKIYLSLREFDKAVEASSWVIDNSAHSLVTSRFGIDANDPEYDVMWDLHQKENKSNNPEGILVVQDKYNIEGDHPGGTQVMRDATPAWWWTPVLDPNGEAGTVNQPGDTLHEALGRGIAVVRTTDWYNYEIWEDPDDLRHSDVNWWSKDDFYYNNPDSEYYGEPFDGSAFSNNDTIRTWFPFAYNKLFVEDEEREGQVDLRGGHSDWYLFRLAETYLLRAEAHYWKDDLSSAAEDINQVRNRAEASSIESIDVTIEEIFAERARELYYEEPRKTELTRVAYIMAQLGRDGYSLDNMDQSNWYHDIVLKNNIFYRENVPYGAYEYRILPYHVYWPVPQNAIDANTQGVINQNEGYPGTSNNIPPIEEVPATEE